MPIAHIAHRHFYLFKLESMASKRDNSIEKLSIINLGFAQEVRQSISVLWVLVSLQLLNDIGGGQEVSRVILPAVARNRNYPVDAKN